MQRLPKNSALINNRSAFSTLHDKIRCDRIVFTPSYAFRSMIWIRQHYTTYRGNNLCRHYDHFQFYHHSDGNPLLLSRINNHRQRSQRPLPQTLPQQQQQWRSWLESSQNPVYVAMQEKKRLQEIEDTMDDVELKLHQIALDSNTETQSIWASVFLNGKLVNGTQIDIPKYRANIDHIKNAVKAQCGELMRDIPAITLQVLATKHQRKKRPNQRKLSKKNRILKNDLLYDMEVHGGESEIAGIIVKAFSRKMQDSNFFAFGT
jgi:hypothetical protein